MSSDINPAAVIFKALGDPTRLRILRLLACCPEQINEGPTAGAVCCEITGAEKITSTISHHLKELREAGLITMERNGKHMICSLDRNALRAIARELTDIADTSTETCCEPGTCL